MRAQASWMPVQAGEGGHRGPPHRVSDGAGGRLLRLLDGDTRRQALDDGGGRPLEFGLVLL